MWADFGKSVELIGSRHLVVLAGYQAEDYFSVPLKKGIDEVKSAVDNNFEKEGSSTAGKWKELSPKTKLMRQSKWWYYKKKSNNPGILRWTGNLQDSVEKTLGKKTGKIEWTASYAKYHQMGRNRRKFIELSQATKTEIARYFLSHVYEETGKIQRK